MLPEAKGRFQYSRSKTLITIAKSPKFQPSKERGQASSHPNFIGSTSRRGGKELNPLQSGCMPPSEQAGPSSIRRTWLTAGRKGSLCLLAFLMTCPIAFCQNASLHGKVVDQTGAVIPKATVTLTAPSGTATAKTAASDGSYSFTGLPPGDYSIQASAPKLEQQPVKVTLRPGSQTLWLELKVIVNTQQMTIQENAAGALSTESSNNASA